MKRFAAVLLTLAVLLCPSVRAAGPGISAASAILIDGESGRVLYAQNAEEERPIASITKLMTALVAVESHPDLSEVVTIRPEWTGVEGSSMYLKAGEELTLEALLYGLLLASGNDAAVAIAGFCAGDVDTFVAWMNDKAAELGMEDTHFSNTHGYHDDDHYTSAYDIYLMCREAMKHETFRTIVGSKNYTMPATNLHPEPRIIRSTNALISNFRVAGYIYEYATGIKTGSTPEAGYCLAASATRENRNLISVVMGCEREPGTSGSEGYIYFDETIRLFKWGFANFSTQTILDNTKRDIPEVEVTLGKDAASVTLMPDGKLTALLPNDVSAENFTYDYTLETRSVEAPVEQGQVLGTITAYFNGRSYGTLDLVATCSVERDPWLYRLDRIQKFFDNLLVRILLVVVLVVIAALLLRVMFFRSRGRTGRRGYAYSGRGRYTGSRRRRG